jgi:hypothetical protein
LAAVDLLDSGAIKATEEFNWSAIHVKRGKMFWSKKKDDRKGLPDLPGSPRAAASMKDFHEVMSPISKDDKEEIHSLPSFPDSPTKKGFSQSAIKDAVETSEPRGSPPGLPELPNSIERPLFHKPKKETNPMPLPPLPKAPKVIEMEEWKPSQLAGVQPTKVMANKPVFVRLDKFQTARDSLAIVKDKLREIDELLRTTREVKMKEDEELSSWEKEIESIKAHINSVQTEIFDTTTGY